MRIGINTFLFTSPFTTQSVKLFPTFKKWGFETVEIPIEDPSHIDPARVQAAAAKHGLVVGSISACTGPAFDFCESVAQRKNAMRYRKSVINLAAEMSSLCSFEPALQIEEYRLVQDLKELAVHAAGKNVTLCIKPLKSIGNGRRESWNRAMRLLDIVGANNLKLQIDVSSGNFEESDTLKILQREAARIGNLHIRIDSKANNVATTEEFQRIASALQPHGYNRDVILYPTTQSEDIILHAIDLIANNFRRSDANKYADKWRTALLKELTELQPSVFEKVIQHILYASGFTQVSVTGRAGDGGIDGIAASRMEGITEFRAIFQVKRYRPDAAVSVREIRDLRGAMAGRTGKALFFTTSKFTADAVREASREGVETVELFDGMQIVAKMKDLGIGIKRVERVEVDRAWFDTISCLPSDFNDGWKRDVIHQDGICELSNRSNYATKT